MRFSNRRPGRRPIRRPPRRPVKPVFTATAGPSIVRPIITSATPNPATPQRFPAEMRARRQVEIAQQQTPTIYDQPYFTDQTAPIEIHDPITESGEAPTLFGSREEEEHLVENITRGLETSAEIMLDALDDLGEDPKTVSATPGVSAAFPAQGTAPKENLAATPNQPTEPPKTPAPSPSQQQQPAKKQESMVPLILVGVAAIALLYLIRKG